MATLNPALTEFRCTMDALNRFMHAHDIPPQMQRRLREYFHQTKHLQMANSQRHLFHMMSPALQGEVAWTANEEWLKRIPSYRVDGDVTWSEGTVRGPRSLPFVFGADG